MIGQKEKEDTLTRRSYGFSGVRGEGLCSTLNTAGRVGMSSQEQVGSVMENDHEETSGWMEVASV